MEVTCRVVSGLDKGFGYDPGCTFTTDSEATHAWNVVHVQRNGGPSTARGALVVLATTDSSNGASKIFGS
ncbi:hypothetical protein C0Q70_02278 [Pomacea canaliculata]|uniref:Uncharacterized protein n=1 Tax=Pomacea canaliculata TaxID=400727 RepID=A0A2T7PPH4_POMCA|nr:hypothetical protein C0Q70_02278 [Pomacea canaliculata]